jgi:hypothetical protein
MGRDIKIRQYPKPSAKERKRKRREFIEKLLSENFHAIQKQKTT